MKEKTDSAQKQQLTFDDKSKIKEAIRQAAIHGTSIGYGGCREMA